MQVQTFEDFDAYASAVSHADVRMMCGAVETPRWHLRHWEHDGLSLQFGKEGGGNVAEGANRQDGSILFIPLSRQESMTLNGEPLDKQSLGVINPGGEFCIAARRCSHTWVSILCPPDLRCEPSSTSPRSCPDAHVVRPGKQAIRRLTDLVSRCPAAVPSLDHALGPARASAPGELLEAIRETLRDESARASSEFGRPRLNRGEVIERVLASLDTTATSSIALAALAQAADVSERTLRMVFHDYFGLSPVRYLKLRLLHKVRQALREASPEDASVTTILASHGVWDFGRFAGSYRAQFGESPSATLRSRR